MTQTEHLSPEPTTTPAEIRLQDESGRDFILIGAGAIDLDSREPISRLIEDEQPDTVCVALDAARYKVLADEAQWESRSIRQVIQEKLGTALLLNLLLAAYQRKLNDSSGVMPGAELHDVAQSAEALSIPVVLVERDINITYNRAWRSLNVREKGHLLLMALRRLLRFQRLTEEAARDLGQTDVLSAFLDEATPLQPMLKETLIDERNQYTIRKMLATPGNKIVGIAGAGRLPGLRQAFLNRADGNLDELEKLPELSPIKKWASRIIPLLLILGIIIIGWTQGGDFIRENLRFWIAANSIFTGIGAILAGAHILTIIVAVVVAPISPLIPAGPGTVAAIVQAVIRPPLVKDFQTFPDDITHILRWRKNRILKIVLVMVLCGLGSLIGTLLGTSKVIWSLFGLN